MKKMTAFYYVIFALFLFIFAGSLITITLPTKTVTTIPANIVDEEQNYITSHFKITTLTYYPNYAIGLGIIATVSLGGVIVTRWLIAKIEQEESKVKEKGPYVETS